MFLAVGGYRLSLIDGFIIQNARLVSSTGDQGGGILRWQSATGRYYTLQRATNLHQANPFVDWQQHLPGQPGFTTYTDTTATATSPRFYRLRLE